MAFPMPARGGGREVWLVLGQGGWVRVGGHQCHFSCKETHSDSFAYQCWDCGEGGGDREAILGSAFLSQRGTSTTFLLIIVGGGKIFLGGGGLTASSSPDPSKTYWLSKFPEPCLSVSATFCWKIKDILSSSKRQRLERGKGLSTTASLHLKIAILVEGP